MATRKPLIVNPTVSQIQELPTGDSLDGITDLTATGTITAEQITSTDDITATGTVTAGNFVKTDGTPIATNTPAFRAQMSADMTLSNSVRKNVEFDLEDFDSGGCYNNTGSNATLNSLTVPKYSFCPNVAGFYYIFASTSVENSSEHLTFARIQICKNGTADNATNVKAACVTGGGSSSNTYEKEATQTASLIIELNGTGDYKTIMTDATNGNQGSMKLNGSGTVRNYFQAYKLIM